MDGERDVSEEPEWSWPTAWTTALVLGVAALLLWFIVVIVGVVRENNRRIDACHARVCPDGKQPLALVNDECVCRGPEPRP